MTTILLLGGHGATGRPLTRHLPAETNHKTVFAGRNLDGTCFVDSLRDPRVTAERVEFTHQALVLARSLGDVWRQAVSLFYLVLNYGAGEQFGYWKPAIMLLREARDWCALAELLSVSANFLILILNGDLELAQQRVECI